MLPPFLLRALTPGGIAIASTAVLGTLLTAGAALMRSDIRHQAVAKCESDHKVATMAAALGAALQDNQIMAETIQRRDLAAAEAMRRVSELEGEADLLREAANKNDPQSGSVVFEAGDEWLTKRRPKK